MKATTDELPGMLSRKDVARALQVSGKTVSRLVRAGRLPAPKVIGSRPRWAREAIEALVRAG